MWNEFVARYHYLGYKTLVGAQMRYAVHDRDGWPLAMLGFSTTAWKLGSYILDIVRCHLPEDWVERYNTTPVLIETFVATRRYWSYLEGQLQEADRLLYDDGSAGPCQPAAEKTQPGEKVAGFPVASLATSLHTRRQQRLRPLSFQAGLHDWY